MSKKFDSELDRLEDEINLYTLPPEWKNYFPYFWLWCVYASDHGATVKEPDLDGFLVWLLDLGFSLLGGELCCTLTRTYLGEIRND